MPSTSGNTLPHSQKVPQVTSHAPKMTRNSPSAHAPSTTREGVHDNIQHHRIQAVAVEAAAAAALAVRCCGKYTDIELRGLVRVTRPGNYKIYFLPTGESVAREGVHDRPGKHRIYYFFPPGARQSGT